MVHRQTDKDHISFVGQKLSDKENMVLLVCHFCFAVHEWPLYINGCFIRLLQ